MTKHNSNELPAVIALMLFCILLALIGIHVPFFESTIAGSFLLGCIALFNKEARPQLLFLGFIMPCAVIFVSQANHVIIYLQPRTIDASLSRLDGGLSVAIYHWTLHHTYVHSFLWVIYYGLPLFTAFVLGLTGRRMACFRAFVLAAIFVPFFYYLFPAVGPAHIGQAGAPRNNVPSLHLAWALELVLYSQSYIRRIAIVYLVLIAASTLGIGEHYIIDLIVAVPYTFAIYWLEARLSRFLPGSRKRFQDTDIPMPAETTAEETTIR